VWKKSECASECELVVEAGWQSGRRSKKVGSCRRAAAAAAAAAPEAGSGEWGRYGREEVAAPGEGMIKREGAREREGTGVCGSSVVLSCVDVFQWIAMPIEGYFCTLFRTPAQQQPRPERISCEHFVSAAPNLRGFVGSRDR
jgi:hypothetical protein